MHRRALPGPEESSQHGDVDDENSQAERRHTAAVYMRPVTAERRINIQVVHLRPVAVESGDDVQQRVDHERVEQRDPGELNEQLVDGGAERRSFQEDKRDGDAREEEIHRGTGSRNHDLLRIREIAWVEGDVASEPVETPVQDLAAIEPDHDRVAEFVQRHRDREQDEERGLIDEQTVFMSEVAVERSPEVARELIDHSHAEHDIKKTNQRERAETHAESPGMWFVMPASLA